MLLPLAGAGGCSRNRQPGAGTAGSGQTWMAGGQGKKSVQRDEFDLASVSRCVLAHSFPDDIDGDIIPGHYTSIILERFECHLNQVEALGFVWDTYADLKPLQAAWERRIARWQEDQRKAELQRAVLRSNHEMPGRWVS
jgi:hypothetical protein